MTRTNKLEIRRHRALADPSRRRVLAELVKHGPLGVRELASRTDLHPNTVRAHIRALVEAELAGGEPGAQGGRGRPRTVYRASAEVGTVDERRYKLLAEILSSAMARSAPTVEVEAELAQVAEVWGRYLVDTPLPFAVVVEDEVIMRLVALLDELGFRPELEAAGADRTQRLLMRSCPFLDLARRHQDVVCPIHLGLMRGALGQLGATTTATQLEPFARPDACIAHLAAAPIEPNG